MPSISNLHFFIVDLCFEFSYLQFKEALPVVGAAVAHSQAGSV
jgi:hypothetical protein